MSMDKIENKIAGKGRERERTRNELLRIIIIKTDIFTYFSTGFCLLDEDNIETIIILIET